MLHQIPVEDCGPQGEAMAEAVSSCVHCGFCLPTCPTYAITGEEMNSPRGRIFLMKDVLEGRLDPADAHPYIDQCLGCQSCVTACPSGVEYGELLSPYRAWSGTKRKHSLEDTVRRKLMMNTIPFPERFRWAARFGIIFKKARAIIPEPFRSMIALIPEAIPAAENFPEWSPAQGKSRGCVALLLGCVQKVIAPSINRATINVLNRSGYDVVIPARQACCGALGMHIGETASAMDSAIRNLNCFPDDIEAIISNAAGCGSAMKEYPLFFKNTEWEEKARNFSEKVFDVCSFLDLNGFVPPAPPDRPSLKVTYHDACHLAHAQGVREAPRRLLKSLPGLELVEPEEWELCCGSAGSYNIEHPQTADILGKRKIQNLHATGAQLIVTGNIGCLNQLRHHADSDGIPPIFHTIELLDQGIDLLSNQS